MPSPQDAVFKISIIIIIIIFTDNISFIIFITSFVYNLFTDMLEELQKPLTDPLMDLTAISDDTLGEVRVIVCNNYYALSQDLKK